ncbi:MAG: hypothetical protein HY059_05550 [Proteobacteria bacterium]|nr:hypothetical protein [Pseudomonadota bacterium]
MRVVAARLVGPFVASLLVATVACRHDATAPDRVASLAVRASAERGGEGGAPDHITTTFEDFTLGAIDGQHDWKSLGGLGAPPPSDPLATHCAVYDHEIADVAAVVPGGGAVRSFGRRSLRISNAVTSGCYSDQTFSSRTADVAGETGAWSRSTDGTVDYALAGAALRSRFEAEWRFASTVPRAQQPGLEVVASPARGDNQRMSWVQMSDLSDGLAVGFVERSNVAAPGDFIYTMVARGLDRRVPHTIRLTMDFVDGPSNDVVRVYVDGELRHTGTSWENYYHYDANGRSNFGGATPVVNRLMFRTGSDVHRGYPGLPAPATRGHGFLIDDVRLSTSGGAQHVPSSER